jgi:hypothetical protein
MPIRMKLFSRSGSTYVVLFGSVALSWLLFQALQLNRGVQSVVVDMLTPNLEGRRVEVPSTDSFGQRLTRSPRWVVAMPPCQSCAEKRLPLSTLRNIDHRDGVALLFSEPSAAVIRRYGRDALNGFFVFTAPLPASIPLDVTVSAPMVLVVQASNHLVKQAMRRDETVDAFINRNRN